MRLEQTGILEPDKLHSPGGWGTTIRAQVHEFWPDDISILDDHIFEAKRIHGPKQLTDLYLLALAVRHGGRFVTFDGAIARDAVTMAGKDSIVIL